ncbi:lycopene cyclase domain-containing protein [Agrococcus sp. ProA11]|uniref:lycopene cyclase domain-containing protein n=1 Tax=Agrococcus chionoecetis TaxID=3153752 RepID=UPI00326024FE
MSYALLLAAPLLATAILAVSTLRSDRRGWAALALAAAAVLTLTVAFDSLMIAIDLFRFDDALLLGLRLGLAPVEDLGYALIALFSVAAIWRLLGRARALDAGTRRADADA